MRDRASSGGFAIAANPAGRVTLAIDDRCLQQNHALSVRMGPAKLRVSPTASSTSSGRNRAASDGERAAVVRNPASGVVQ